MKITFEEYISTLKAYKKAILEGNEEIIVLIEGGATILNN